jgi:hypothetical protein
MQHAVDIHDLIPIMISQTFQYLVLTVIGCYNGRPTSIPFMYEVYHSSTFHILGVVGRMCLWVKQNADWRGSHADPLIMAVNALVFAVRADSSLASILANNDTIIIAIKELASVQSCHESGSSM